MALQYIIIILLCFLCCALLLVYRMARRIDVSAWNLQGFIVNELTSALRVTVQVELDNFYRQMESLYSLNDLLHLPKPLPPLRGWAGSPDFLLALAEEVMRRKPVTVVECSSGASTVVAARCCQLNGTGHVYSLENAEEFASKTRRLLKEANLCDWATVIHAPLNEVFIAGENYPWYSLSDLVDVPIDLVVVDGPPAGLREQSRYPAGPLLISRLSAGGAVMLDDADRADERKIIERWKAEFPGLRAEKRSAEKGLVVLIREAS